MKYSRSVLSHLTAEVLALKDEPREPMTIIVRIELDEPLKSRPLQDWQNATLKLFDFFPRLKDAFVLHADGYKWQPVERSPKDLNEIVWQFQNLALEEFQNLSLDPQAAPLFRARFHETEGLSLIIHHALGDGMALVQLTGKILDGVIQSTLREDTASTSQKRSESDFNFSMIQSWILTLTSIFTALKRAFKPIIKPTVFLGPIEQRFGTGKHFHIQKTLPHAVIKRLLQFYKIKYENIKINDLVLAAYHRALWRLIKNESQQNLKQKLSVSILVSVNLRRWQSAPITLCNWSSNIPCETKFDHHDSFDQLVRTTTEEMKKAKSPLNAFAMMNFLKWADQMGLIMKGRKHRLQHGTPTRIQNGKPTSKGAQWLDTAILSNIGNMPSDYPGLKYIKALYGVAPVLPPTSAALGVISTPQGIHFYLRASDCHFNLDRAEKLMSYILLEFQDHDTTRSDIFVSP